MLYIYVLQLENNRYYIGKTINLKYDIKHNFNGNGVSFTKLYKPIYILQIYNCKESDEDECLNFYMQKYGKNNVRSGSFIYKTNEISDEYCGTSVYTSMCDKYCIKCHQEGHYCMDCTN